VNQRLQSLDPKWVGTLLIGVLVVVVVSASAGLTGTAVTLPIIGEVSGLLATLLGLLAGVLLSVQLWQPTD
jgi:hypothetical protein